MSTEQVPGRGSEDVTGAAAEAPGPVRAGRTSAAGSALEKSLRILEAVAAPGGPHRLTDVMTAAAVPKSSTFRILAALAEQGFVRAEGDGRYGTGPRLHGLSALVRAAEPAGVDEVLRELRRETGQTVHLALHTGETITYVRKLEADQPFRTASRVGTRMPLHTTAIGKSVLALLPPEEVRALVASAGLPRRTPRTLTTAAELEAELAAVRARGFAVDDEENEPSIRCAGVAVPGPDGRPLGGVSVTTVTFLVSRQEAEGYAPALRAAAKALAPLL
ncbi:IclR family transcriptional regulator [Streptomyces lavendulae]|uniref:Acetate operon repressor n=1 Tax=Streptomyces lavendulae subsp. lavendulae TaxID=58340 RepID=A0A2K8P7S7_STRLA|nr:IclR family transcriptional regulator [Streptomyces lavendulae]ATZ22789.1 Acetate operon repressor [Streptomyces lavendulae subsp. lavendulae]QUQ52631.1 HTH-type transcriptional regulator XynR [Streptomyces lavendulae subsp. lavendulae]